MNIESIREFISQLWQEYQRAEERRERSKILDAVCTVLGIHRKSAIRLLNRGQRPTYRKKTHKPREIYSQEIKNWIVTLWHELGRMCSKKFVEALPEWMPFCVERHGFSARVMDLLLRVSARTVDRILHPIRSELRRKGISGTTPGKLTVEFPLKPLGVKITEPGHIEVDTVALCGTSLSGDFIWILTATDIFSGMTFNQAVWGKSGLAVAEALGKVESALPFKVRAFYSDNGNEFLNGVVLHQFVKRELNPVPWYRGRAYRKNDQSYVEQKNFTSVRQLLGYTRFDDKRCIEVLNRTFLEAWCPIQNYFVPQFKTVQKIRIGAKVKRVLDRPKTPVSRLLESGKLSPQEKEKLLEEMGQINPYRLKDGLAEKLKIIRQYIGIRASGIPARFVHD